MQPTQLDRLTVLLWRHAPTPDNSSGRLQGRRDTETGEAGLEVGREAARNIADRYGLPSAIWSSPLRRASETAQLLTDLGGPQWEREDGITQRSYGVWEGMTLEQVAREYPQELMVRDSGGDPNIPGWEVGKTVGKRVSDAITVRCNTLFAKAASLQREGDSTLLDELGENIRPAVFVSHGSAIASGARDLLGLPEQPRILGHLRHANWVELRYSPHGAKPYGSQWTLQRFNSGPS